MRATPRMPRVTLRTVMCARSANSSAVTPGRAAGVGRLAGAPRLDMLTPDIYQPNFEAWCRKYTQRGNPLFIPEMRRDEVGARNVFYAIGQHDAIGVSPFAVDSLEQPAQAPLGKSYAVLQQLTALILEHHGQGELAGFLLDAEHPSVERRLGEYDLEISLDEIFGYKAELDYGLLIAVGPNEFVGAGSGFRVAFRPTSAGPARVGIGAVDEGVYRDGACCFQLDEIAGILLRSICQTFI